MKSKLSRMRILRIALIVLASYVGLALLFDGMIAVFQPGSDVLRSYDEEGPHDTVLSVIEDGDTLWVESGHHFRGWYYRIRDNPEVELIRSGDSKPYRAVPLDDPETRAHLIGLIKQRAGAGYYVTRFLLLFAPIKPVRLDPR